MSGSRAETLSSRPRASVAASRSLPKTLSSDIDGTGGSGSGTKARTGSPTTVVTR